MSDKNSGEKLIPDFIKHVQDGNRDKLLLTVRQNKNSYKTIYNNDKNIFGKNDWKNYLLEFYLSEKTEDQVKKLETKSFLDLARRVDLFLKNNVHILETTSDDEYKRNMNLCKDTTIPCSNITSSFQSIDNLIKNFFFCIYAADHVLRYEGTSAEKPIVEKDDFFNMFEQKIYSHPQTLKYFFSIGDSSKDLIINDKVKDDHQYSIKSYFDSISNGKKRICEIFESFIRKCNNIFFTLMCRWFDIFLNSIQLIPSQITIQTLVEYIDSAEPDEVTTNLNDIIQKNVIYKKLAETSKASSYMMTNTVKCFNKYINIVKDCDIPKDIKEKIDKVLNFEYGDTDEFGSDEYQFSEAIKQTIFSDDHKQSKREVALLIENTINIISTP